VPVVPAAVPRRPPTSGGVNNDTEYLTQTEAAELLRLSPRTLERMRLLRRDALSAEDKLNYDLLEWQLTHRIAFWREREYLMPVNQLQGFHIAFPQLADRSRLLSFKDHENYVARMEAFPRYVRQHIELMRLAFHMTNTRVSELVRWL